MKRIVCRSTQRLVDDGTVIAPGTPHFEADSVADELIRAGIAAEAPLEEAAPAAAADEALPAGAPAADPAEQAE